MIEDDRPYTTAPRPRLKRLRFIDYISPVAMARSVPS